MRCRLIPAWSPVPQIQAFFEINAPRALMIVRPAFTPQQHMNAGDTITHTSFGDLFDSCSESTIIARSPQFEIDN
jgi:hypothetical protein